MCGRMASTFRWMSSAEHCVSRVLSSLRGGMFLRTINLDLSIRLPKKTSSILAKLRAFDSSNVALTYFEHAHVEILSYLAASLRRARPYSSLNDVTPLIAGRGSIG
jgi:hypothetical protein